MRGLSRLLPSCRKPWQAGGAQFLPGPRLILLRGLQQQGGSVLAGQAAFTGVQKCTRGLRSSFSRQTHINMSSASSGCAHAGGTLPLLPLTSSHRGLGRVLLFVCSRCSHGCSCPLPASPGCHSPEEGSGSPCGCVYSPPFLLAAPPAPAPACPRPVPHPMLTLVTAARVTRPSLAPSRSGAALQPSGMSRSALAAPPVPVTAFQ